MSRNLGSVKMRRGCFALGSVVLLCCGTRLAAAQDTTAANAQPAGAQPVAITLQEAIHRAQANEPAFAAAIAASRVAGLDKSIARAGLLPGVTFHNQYLYTEPNGQQNQAGQTGGQAAPKFIANNAVREYASQGIVDETIGVAQVAAFKRADAAAAVAAAELEIARRGLAATVAGLYYGAMAADHRVAIAESAHTEAEDFLSLTGKREQQRESAHADVVKAQLQEQQRTRELSDARVAAEKARLELGVLLFPDPRTPYTVAAPGNPQLASRADIEQAAG